MKRLVSSCLLLLPLLSFGQLPLRTDSIAYPGGNSLALELAATSDGGTEAARLADADIATGHLFLLLQGGIAPVLYSGDQAFCRKFSLVYWEEGCTGPAYTNMQVYNGRMFDYLTSRYGRSWLAEVRKDVVGLREWKKKRGR